MAIEFYSTGDEYGEFSNFAAFPFTLDGERWPTSEHYFQARKFRDEARGEEIRKTASAMVAARMGRSRSAKLREDWEFVKDDIMRKVVRAKFMQHEEIRKNLLETGDALLVEHTAKDSYWADGGDGHGRNMLGQILMEIRDEISRQQESDSDA